jgi:hypothetical protein
MSDASPSSPPRARPTPWSVRKIVEQVTGQPLSAVQGNGPASPLRGRSPGEPRLGLPAFLPGTLGEETPASLPLPHPLHFGPLVDEQSGERVLPRGEGHRAGGEPPASKGPRSGALELERVYLHYLLLHLDRLGEPALKYLRHAVEEECRDRGWEP